MKFCHSEWNLGTSYNNVRVSVFRFIMSFSVCFLPNSATASTPGFELGFDHWETICPLG